MLSFLVKHCEFILTCTFLYKKYYEGEDFECQFKVLTLGRMLQYFTFSESL